MVHHGHVQGSASEEGRRRAADQLRGVLDCRIVATGADVVTMDKIVALCRRRGFVFPSSEIYGGIGSTYDYRHQGGLTKEKIPSPLFCAMVEESGDIVALHSAHILQPRGRGGSRPAGGLTRPPVRRRTCQ